MKTYLQLPGNVRLNTCGFLNQLVLFVSDVSLDVFESADNDITVHLAEKVL